MKPALITIAALLLVVTFLPLHHGSVRVNGQEMATIRQIARLNQAQWAYFGVHGAYAPSLADLKLEPAPGWWIDLRLSDSGYAVLAIPKRFGEDGRRTFYSDETLVIRNEWSDTKLASATSDAIQ